MIHLPIHLPIQNTSLRFAPAARLVKPAGKLRRHLSALRHFGHGRAWCEVRDRAVGPAILAPGQQKQPVWAFFQAVAPLATGVSEGRRASAIAPMVWSAWGPPSSSFSLTHEGAERRNGASQTGHLTKAPACRLTGTRASRRSTAAILGAVTVLLRSDRRDFPSRYPGRIGAALHPIASSHQGQPPHRVRTVTAPPGPWLRATDAGAAPCSVDQASLDDALN